MDTIEDLSLGPLLKGECAIKWKPCSFWYFTCKDIMYSERTGSAGVWTLVLWRVQIRHSTDRAKELARINSQSY